MARISTYPVDSEVIASDKWIGSDFQNSNQTKNFTPITLANFLNHNQVIDYANSLRYFYQTLEPGENRGVGSISFPTEIGVSIPFSTLNNFLLSNRTLKQNEVTEYLDFLIGSKITISNSSNTNLFGFYEVLDISTYIPDPNFLSVSLEYIVGNGEMLEDTDYLISLVDKASGDAIPTLTSELTNDGEDGVNPFISLADLPYQIEIYVDVESFPPVGQDELIYFAEYPGTFYLWNGEEGDYDQITSNAFPTGLERLTEGTNTGWRLIGRNRTYYGPIGIGAVDLSYSNSASEVLGATGPNSFAVGQSAIASGQSSASVAGNNNKATGTYSFIGGGSQSDASGNNTSVLSGYFAKARSFCEHVIGSYNTDYTPTSTTGVSPTDRSFVVGAGTIGNLKDVLTVYKNGAVKFFVEALANITNGTAGFFTFNSTDNNRPYIHNGTAWKALAYTDDSVIPTLQEVLDNNHDLVDNKNYQGTGAGVGNTGLSVNALGNKAGNLNSGSFANLLGTNAGKQNSGSDLNAFGKDAGQSNSGVSVNALGNGSGNSNLGTNVNALGNQAGGSNSGNNLNALGFLAGQSNSGTNVNALGVQAGWMNTFKNINLFGYFASADADNQTVFSKWISGTTKYLARISFNNITADRKYELPDASGTIALTTDIPTNTSDLINDGDDGNPFISLLDLPSNIIFYPTTVASDISGYVKIVTSITDPDYNTTAVDVSTGAITTTSQLISSLATSPNIIVGNPGVFNITTIGNIRRISGSGEASFYFQVYKRTSAGVETLIATSDNTIPVIDGGTYIEFSSTAIWNDGEFLDTDRVVMKYYANRIAGGSNPTYQFQFGGVTPVRTLVPIPLSVVPILTIDAVPTDGSTNAVSSNGVFDALALKVGQAVLTQTGNTSTIVGWSSFNFKIIKEFNFENGFVVVEYFLDGTSNSATTSFTLTHNNISHQQKEVNVAVRNNGTTSNTNGLYIIGGNSNVVNFYQNNAETAFTGSNQKVIRGKFIYYKG